MSNDKWHALRQRVHAAIDESRVIVGHEHFYRTQTMREVLEWIEEAQAGRGVVLPLEEEGAYRLVCGTGVDDQGKPYEVVRRVRAKEYRVEFTDGLGGWFKITLADAVRFVQVPNLGVEGLSAFDRAWTNAHQAA